MWENLKKKLRKERRSGELYYATHYHLIPLYVIAGLLIVATLVLSCFLIVLWQNFQKEAARPGIETAIAAVEDLYLPTTVAPNEKKQYVYPANLRFTAIDPYDGLRYSYDPGVEATAISSVVVLSSTSTLKSLEAPLRNDPLHGELTSPNLQQCSRLYVIRFQPGVTPYGGFIPLKDIRLKDGRTAYIHKNVLCVPKSTAVMNTNDEIEKVVLSVESY